MGLRRLLPLLLASVVACTEVPAPPSARAPGGATPAALPAGPEDMTAALLAKPLPVADPFELVRRLKGRDGVPSGPFQAVRATAPDEPVGTRAQFWIYDFEARRNVRVAATLRVVTAHAKWWVADDAAVDERALRATAGVFEERIYPTNRRLWGEEWSPGIDGDVRISILVANIPGRAAGYFNAPDEYPAWVNEFSAEREMIYVNALGARLGTDGLLAVLAHEFCHMQQFNRRVRSVAWFNEGFAQLCEQANGLGSGFEQLFLRLPDTQLNAWSELDSRHYGGSLLFFDFLRQHAGGDGLIEALVAAGVGTPEDIDRVLRQRGQPGLETLFADFVAANAFIGQGPEERFAYAGSRQPRIAAEAAREDRVALGASHRATVHQYAARYVELPREAMRVRFDGARTTRLIPADPRSGKAFWWSDRLDSLDSKLTRGVDLRGVTTATLTFWSWYDIEPDYDYAYVAVSTDGGRRWTTLAATTTTAADPNGNNLGHGFTGASGGKEPAWIQQRVDLSAYAGKEIQLRFEYVTDQALNEHGFAVDDIEIAEIGYRDDAEADGGWQPDGFIRSSNLVRQRYIVQVLRFRDRPTVERHVVENGALELALDPSGDRRAPLLAVSGLAPRTTVSATFTVAVTRR